MASSGFLGTIRSCVWPVQPHERKKLVPMMLMLFLIIFAYDLLRNMKDAVIVTAAGAEVIPFVKVWALLPGAILLTFIFTKLSNRFSQERVFYIMLSGFLIFFILFAFLLYPIRQSLHAEQLADWLKEQLPSGFKGLVSMMRYWSFTLFYVMAELWGTIVMTVLFWGFANEVTRIHEARRFYSVFSIWANCAGILAGQLAGFLPNEGGADSIRSEDWGSSLMILVAVICVCGVAVMGLFRWMNRNVLNDPSFDELHKTKRELKAKGKLSFKESFSYLSNSKYLLCIAILVVAYNLVINLVEVVWKDQLRLLYPSPGDFYGYMSNITSLIGIVSVTVSIFMARIINRFGWTRTALITPIMMLVTSAGFFGFFLFRDSMSLGMLAMAGATPLVIAVFFGAAQNCLSKGMKYSVFDVTKEMAFIPLSHECKLKGKAAIDGVGSRLGKSGGSLIHTGLLMTFGSLSASAPFVAAILMVVIGFWIMATRSLGRQFNALTSTEEPESVKAPILATQLPAEAK
ncbi:MAG: NTP/NDP exchange transporter [Parachlamydia sp.]|nr:NTP/NDP exchange transporter [Parachlamydia sp.]